MHSPFFAYPFVDSIYSPKPLYVWGRLGGSIRVAWPVLRAPIRGVLFSSPNHRFFDDWGRPIPLVFGEATRALLEGYKCSSCTPAPSEMRGGNLQLDDILMLGHFKITANYSMSIFSPYLRYPLKQRKIRVDLTLHLLIIMA